MVHRRITTQWRRTVAPIQGDLRIDKVLQTNFRPLHSSRKNTNVETFGRRNIHQSNGRELQRPTSQDLEYGYRR